MHQLQFYQLASAWNLAQTFKTYPVSRFYGQLNIHKIGVSTHRIVSYSNSPLKNVNRYMANSLKANLKIINKNNKNSTTLFNYIRNVATKDDEIMVLCHLTHKHTDN